MKSAIFLSALVFFFFGSLQGLAQTSRKNSTSYFEKGQNNVKPPSKEENVLTRSSDTQFNFVGSWCAISEIGFDGDEVINDIYSTGQCMVWFNEDGTYVVSNYRDHDIFLRRWWYLNDNTIGDSDGFVITLISYKDGIFTGHITNIEKKDYSTTATMKRDNKLSLSIGKGFGYLKDNETKYIVGASADGETKLRIDVKSIVDNYAAYDVTFSSDYGNTEEICGTANDFKKTGESTAEFLYTVPKEFPAEDGVIYTVNMKLTLYDANRKILTYGELPIKIVRPPVLCVHGLNDKGTCFASFTSYLYGSGCYFPFQLYRSDYHPTSCMEFSTNQSVVPRDLKKLFLNCYQQGIIASKADIVGHSMGGLLSRMYIQNTSQKGVNRLITLNTPHFGSQGACLIVNDCKPYVFQELGEKIFGEDSGAVNDLQVNSIAMTNLARSSNQLKGIPIHTVCTDYTCNSKIDTYGSIPFMAIIYILCDTRGMVLKPFMMNELASSIYKGPSDFVVSLTSQKGGLNNNHTSTFEGDDNYYCHVLTPNMPIIQAHLKSLLTKPNNEQAFSKNGLVYKVEPYLDEKDIKAIYDKISLFNLNNKNVSASTTTRSSSSIQIKKCELDDSRRLNVTCETSSDIENYVIIAMMEDGTAFMKDELSFQEPISPEYGGIISIYAMARTASGEIISDAASVKANHILDETQYEYAEFENGDADALLIFKGESVAPLLNLQRTDGQSELILPDQYNLPDLGEKPNNFVEIKDGRIYGISEGSGILTGIVSSFSAEIPYKVIDPSSIELSDGTETGIEMTPDISNRDKEGVVNFTFSPEAKTGNVSFAKADLSTILIQIYDINGKLQKSFFIQQPQNETLINLDFLPSGIYIIRFAEKTFDETFKFIIP